MSSACLLLVCILAWDSSCVAQSRRIWSSAVARCAAGEACGDPAFLRGVAGNLTRNLRGFIPSSNPRAASSLRFGVNK